MFDFIPDTVFGVPFGDLLAIVIAARVVAEMIVNLTPTPKDNEAISKFYRVIEVVGGIWSLKAKQR